MKQLMISETPERLVNILNGNATLLLRKYIPKDFKGWVNVYCGKGGNILHFSCGDNYLVLSKPSNKIYRNPLLNGKVVARFWFDEWHMFQAGYSYATGVKDLYYDVGSNFREMLQLEDDDINAYGNGKPLYVWHIKQLEIFDKPKELGEFANYNKVSTIFKNQINGQSLFGNSIGCKYKEFRKLNNDISYYGCKLQKDYTSDCDWEYCPLCKLTHAPQKYAYCFSAGKNDD